jgi:hypothetical protein
MNLMKILETLVNADDPDRSFRPKQEFQPSAETEYSIAKNHRIFGFGRTFGTFSYSRPKGNDKLHTNSKICQNLTTSLKFDVCLPRFNHYYMLTNN